MAMLLAAAVLCCLVTLLPRPASAGTLVDARCPCGYHKDHLPLFGGKATFKTVCRFPALCRTSHELVLVNILDPLAPAKDCPGGRAVRYDDPSLAPTEPGELVESWNVPGRDQRVVLTSGGYVCPRCGRRTLHFFRVGFWD